MYKTKEEILDYLRKTGFQKRLDKLIKKYKGQKVIIYGGGGIFFETILENYDLSGFNIIGLSDIRFKDNEEYKGFKTFAPASIKAQNPDVVLIATLESAIIEDYFEDELFPEHGKFKYEPFVQTSFIELIKALF
ncbi:MAG: hypothetical protein GX568_03100 [Candidatus Gastranaerophilales bacterium]|nr:hypothetical protein [Candidatus Gastranaerophilales bacterium]